MMEEDGIAMKIRIETDERLEEPEIIIRGRNLDGDIAKVQAAIIDVLTKNRKLPLIKNGKDYYLHPENILFFEATEGKVYAHSPSNMYEVKQKLYELESTLPSSFVRVSKSVVIGTKYILSISRNLTGPSIVQFRGSPKQVTISRSYYTQFRDKLNERSLL